MTGALRVDDESELFITDSVLSSNGVKPNDRKEYLNTGAAITCMGSSRITATSTVFLEHRIVNDRVALGTAAVVLDGCVAQFVDCDFQDNVVFWLTWTERAVWIVGSEHLGAGAIFLKNGALELHSCRFVRNGAVMSCRRPVADCSSASNFELTKCAKYPDQCLQCTIPCKKAMSGTLRCFRGAADIDIRAGYARMTNTSFTKLGSSPWALDVNRPEAWVNARSGTILTAVGSVFGTQAHPLHRRCIMAQDSSTRLQLTATSLINCTVEWGETLAWKSADQTKIPPKIGALNSIFLPPLSNYSVDAYLCQDRTKAGCDRDANCTELLNGGVDCQCLGTANELEPYGQKCRQRTTAELFLEERNVHVIIRKPEQVQSCY